MHGTLCPEATTGSGHRIPPPQHTLFHLFLLLVLACTLRLRNTPELLRSVLALLSCTSSAGQSMGVLVPSKIGEQKRTLLSARLLDLCCRANSN